MEIGRLTVDVFLIRSGNASFPPSRTALAAPVSRESSKSTQTPQSPVSSSRLPQSAWAMQRNNGRPQSLQNAASAINEERVQQGLICVSEGEVSGIAIMSAACDRISCKTWQWPALACYTLDNQSYLADWPSRWQHPASLSLRLPLRQRRPRLAC